jgi:hypothetical protein
MLNAKYHTKDVKKTCESKLKIEFRKGKEFNGWYKLNKKKIARITISKGRKPIPSKTYQTMAKQLKLTIEQFDNLLKCPLTGVKYKKLITEIIT